MSLAERKLPQYCWYRCRSGSFKPEEGVFVDNNTRFVCFGCRNRLRRKAAIKRTAKVSLAELKMVRELHRSGRKFKQHFKLDSFEFDFAFPDERLLLELDGQSHTYHHQKTRDRRKSESAERHGWRCVRVRYGPGMLRRVSDALSAVVMA